jgi:hypothetical protein
MIWTPLEAGLADPDFPFSMAKLTKTVKLGCRLLSATSEGSGQGGRSGFTLRAGQKVDAIYPPQEAYGPRSSATCPLLL